MRVLGLFILVISTVWGAPVVAQERLADIMEQVREQAAADKKRFIEENLHLTTREAALFWPVYERYQHDLGEVDTRLATLLRNYGKHSTTMADGVADRLITEAVRLEVKRTKLAESYLPQFRKALPGTKLARYYQLESKIRAVFNYDLAREVPLVP